MPAVREDVLGWPSKHTTRVEDVACSLLGTFDVNMALLYGEFESRYGCLPSDAASQLRSREL